MSSIESLQLAERWVLDEEASIRESESSDLSESIETVLNFSLDGEFDQLWQFILASYKLEMSPTVLRYSLLAR